MIGGMPELPDVVVYIEALKSRISDQPLERIRLASPFLVRSVDPPIRACSAASATPTPTRFSIGRACLP